MEIVNKKCAQLQKEIITQHEVNSILLRPAISSQATKSTSAEQTPPVEEIVEETNDPKNHKKEMKEIRSLKTRIRTLENIIRDQQNNKNLLTQAEASKAQLVREKQINDIFIKFGLDPNRQSNEVNTTIQPCAEVTEVTKDDNLTPSPDHHCENEVLSPADKTQSVSQTISQTINHTNDYPNTKIPIISNEKSTESKKKTRQKESHQSKILSLEDVEKVIINNLPLSENKNDVDNNNQNIQQRNDNSISQDENVVGNTEKYKADTKKGKNANRWCFYELYKKGTCQYGKDCKFSHRVPENGPEIMQNWLNDKLQK